MNFNKYVIAQENIFEILGGFFFMKQIDTY